VKPIINWSKLPDCAKYVCAVGDVYYWSEKKPKLVATSPTFAEWHIAKGQIGTCAKRVILKPYTGCWTKSLVKRKGGSK